MEALHEDKEPCAGISASLLEAIHGGRLAGGGLARVRVGYPVLLHAGEGEVLLTLVEPVCGQGCVGEEPKAEDGDDGCDGTLDDEEPGVFLSVLVL